MTKRVLGLATAVLAGASLSYASVSTNATANAAEDCLTFLKKELKGLSVVPYGVAASECGKCCVRAEGLKFKLESGREALEGSAEKVVIAELSNSAKVYLFKGVNLPVDEGEGIKVDTFSAVVFSDRLSFEVDNLTLYSYGDAVYFPVLWGGGSNLSEGGVRKDSFFVKGTLKTSEASQHESQIFYNYSGAYDEKADELKMGCTLLLSEADDGDSELFANARLKLTKVKTLVEVLERLNRGEAVDDFELQAAVLSIVPEEVYLKVNLSESALKSVREDEDYKEILAQLKFIAEKEKGNLVGRFADALASLLSGEKDTLVVKVVNKDQLTIMQLAILVNRVATAVRSGKFDDSILTEHLQIEIYAK